MIWNMRIFAAAAVSGWAALALAGPAPAEPLGEAGFSDGTALAVRVL